MSPGKICLSHCVLMVLLATCAAGIGSSDGAREGKSVDSRRRLTVSGYCEKFARQYSENNAMGYREGSASTKKKSDVMMGFSNLFAPSDSRFTSGYDCRFRAGRKGKQGQDYSVGLFLTGTLHFAEYTQWKKLQIIPIEHVMDEANDRAGYGVFKYLDKP